MEVTFAGSGGQGVVTSGNVFAYVAAESGYEVLWTPAYGGQMRGGKAYSTVIFSHEPIYEPMMSTLDVLVAMNEPSLDFTEVLKDDGILIVNADVVDRNTKIDTPAKVLWLPVDSLAVQVKAPKAANIVSVGMVVREMGFDREKAGDIICRVFERNGKGRFNEGNMRAFNAGYDYHE
ncbi:MAG: 2-oxoacid:acceptor oxidoreductase family protein [Clostridia bacterium]|nr:2-oxoacid:acceptor oxidoreductase family protein [Clostridia bacterium]